MRVRLKTQGSAAPAGAEVDPELERQLECAAKDQPVEAVLFLRQQGPAGASSGRFDRLVAREVARGPAGLAEARFLPRLGALIVRACPAAIRRLIRQPEVELACANRPAAPPSLAKQEPLKLGR